MVVAGACFKQAMLDLTLRKHVLKQRSHVLRTSKTLVQQIQFRISQRKSAEIASRQVNRIPQLFI